MYRLLVLFIALALPFQFAWSATSAYCQHENGEQQRKHFGHHFHAHKSAAKKSLGGKPVADSDCATCNAGGPAMAASEVGAFDFSSAAAGAAPGAMPSFASALARAPDRPQWLRLV